MITTPQVDGGCGRNMHPLCDTGSTWWTAHDLATAAALLADAPRAG